MVNKSIFVKNHRKRRKELLVKLLGGSCSICKYDKCMSALEFHHVDPNQKEFSIGAARANPKSLESLINELNKCILVCSNCHKEIHARLVKQSLLNSIIEARNLIKFESYIYLDKYIESKKKKAYYCLDCKSTVWRKSTRCPKCHSSSRETNDWNSESLQKDLLSEISAVKLGKKYNVSDKTIGKWRKRLTKEPK